MVPRPHDAFPAGTLCAGIVALLVLFAQSGCRGFPSPKWLAQEPCVFSEQPTKEQLIQHINRRASMLSAWRSSDVKIVVRGPNVVPVPLNADIAVESPQNFRLVAKSLMGYEADFGSNDELFWFWMRRSEEAKHVFYARHRDIELVQRRLPVPFRPDWVMGALGVVPLDANNVEMQPPGPESTTARLISRETSPGGHLVYRIIDVDTCRGDVVRQSLQDELGNTIAHAEFGAFSRNEDTQIRMPHQIVFRWPQAQATMTLTVGRIDANSPPQNLWELPQYNGYTPFDLAHDTLGRGPSGPGPVARHSAPRARPVRPRRNSPEQSWQRSGRVRVDAAGFGKSGSQRRRGGNAEERPRFDDERGSSRRGGAEAGPAGRVRLPANPPPFPETTIADRPDFADE